MKHSISKISSSKESISFSLMAIGIFCLFNLPLVIKRGHSYAVIILLIGSLFCLLTTKKKTLLKKDKYFITAILIYAFVSLFIGIYHGEMAKTLEHSLKFLIFIPLAIYLFKYPPTALFVFVSAALGASGSGFIALWNKFHLGISRASDHLNPIFFAEICLLLVIFCLCGIKLAQKIQSPKKKNAYITLMIIGALSGLVATILSASRGAWIALPVILIGLILLYQLTKRQTLLFITISALILSSSYFIPETGVKLRVHQAISAFQPNSREFSVSARIDMWKIAIPMIKEQPLLGWGEEHAVQEKQELVKRKLGNPKILIIQHWHNIFIEKLVKQGILGFIALLILFITPLSLFVNEIIRTNSTQNRTLAYCGTIIILSHMIFGISDLLLQFNIGTIFYCLPITILLAMMQRTNLAN